MMRAIILIIIALKQDKFFDYFSADRLGYAQPRSTITNHSPNRSQPHPNG